MAGIGTLFDDFATEDTGTWTGYADSSVNVVSGQLVIDCTASYPTLYTTATYDATGGKAQVEVVQAASDGGGTTGTYFQLVADASNNVEMCVENGNLIARKKVATVTTDITSTTYNSSTHRWWRIREASGTTYWDYSSDRVTWNNLTSASNPITVTAVTVTLFSGFYGSETGIDPAIFDNFNIVTFAGDPATAASDGSGALLTNRLFTGDPVSAASDGSGVLFNNRLFTGDPVTAASDGSGVVYRNRSLTGDPATAASGGSGAVTVVLYWRLVQPTRIDRYDIEGSLTMPNRVSPTIYGPSGGPLVAEYGPSRADLDAADLVFYGGHDYTTTDAALISLWQSSGFTVEEVEA